MFSALDLVLNNYLSRTVHVLVFVAWRRLSERTRRLARFLNAEILYYPTGITYYTAYRKTVSDLTRLRPRVVIAQLPQGPLLWCLVKLKRKLNFKLVADVHTGFLVYDNFKCWILNRPFRNLLRECDLVIVHNRKVLELLDHKVREKTIVVYDPLPEPRRGGKRLIDRPYILVPASWNPDEPLDYILQEFTNAKTDYILVVTGNYNRRPRLYKKYKDKPNIVFTGYVSEEQYHALLEHCDIVLTGTKREYTMLNAIWEAIAYEKPIMTTETKTLKDILRDSALYYRPSEAGSLSNVLANIRPETLGKFVERVRALRKRISDEINDMLLKLKRLIQELG